MTNHCGVVAIIGRPNTGKSTLLNYILGEKVAAVSSVPQTTRNAIRGILTEARGQIIFVDTPGIHKPKHRLGKYMNMMAQSAGRDADVIVHLADSSEAPGEEESMVVGGLAGEKKKIILALNKIDLGGKFIGEYIKLWEEKKAKPLSQLAEELTVIPISSRKGTNVDKLLGLLFSSLPEGQNLYPDDMLSDFPRKLAYADIIREKLFASMRQEVPHSIAVLVEEITERSKKLTYIKGLIIVERPSQKAIVIGAGGQALKEAGSLSRKELEELLEKKVFLDLEVKVMPGWKSKHEILKLLGYFS